MLNLQNKKNLRFQGMVLVNADINPTSCMEFEADVYLLFHNNYLCKGFQTVIHVGNVCQTAKIVKLNKARYVNSNSSNNLMEFAVGFF